MFPWLVLITGICAELNGEHKTTVLFQKDRSLKAIRWQIVESKGHPILSWLVKFLGALASQSTP